MELKDFQQQVLDTFDAYLNELAVQRANSEKMLEAFQAVGAKPDADTLRVASDYPNKAWTIMKGQGRLPKVRTSVPFSPRQDGAKRAVPSVCFKIPTGGGKTLLAVGAVSRVLGTIPFKVATLFL